jgi:fructokinase
MQRDVVLLFGEVLFDVFPDSSHPGGAPLNVARHLRAFGFAPRLITRTGSDPERAELLDLMRFYRLDDVGVQVDPLHPTGRVLVEMGARGHSFRILPDQAYDHIDADLARLSTVDCAPALVYFGTLAQRGELSRQALRTVIENVPAPRFLDINLRSPWYDEAVVRESLLHADIAKVNDEELAEIGRLLSIPERGRAHLARALIERFDIGKVLVTLGAHGAWLLDRNGTEHEVAAQAEPTRVVDSVGAGDGFSAVFIVGLLRGWSLTATLERADEFARALCNIRGAIPQDESFYPPWRREWGLETEGAE